MKGGSQASREGSRGRYNDLVMMLATNPPTSSDYTFGVSIYVASAVTGGRLIEHRPVQAVETACGVIRGGWRAGHLGVQKVGCVDSHVLQAARPLGGVR